MTDFIEELSNLSEKFDHMHLSSFIDKSQNFDASDDKNVDSLIESFFQLEIAKDPKITNDFYVFILKCINRDNKYVNNTIFIPPVPPSCR